MIDQRARIIWPFESFTNQGKCRRWGEKSFSLCLFLFLNLVSFALLYLHAGRLQSRAKGNNLDGPGPITLVSWPSAPSQVRQESKKANKTRGFKRPIRWPFRLPLLYYRSYPAPLSLIHFGSLTHTPYLRPTWIDAVMMKYKRRVKKKYRYCGLSRDNHTRRAPICSTGGGQERGYRRDQGINDTVLV